MHTRLTLTVPNKAARRVIAPYVKVVRKRYKAPSVPESKLFKRYLERKPDVLLRDLTSFLSDNVDLPSLLHESSDVLKVTTHSRGVSLYLVDPATSEIYQSQSYFDLPEPRVRWKVEEGTIVAAHVAFNKKLVKIDDILQEERFPSGIGQKDQLTKAVLCVPVVTPDGDCYAVIELFRSVAQEPFSDKDLQITSLVTSWMGAAIYQNLERVAVHKKQELNDYLLELTKVFLEEFVPAENMIIEMVKFMKLTLAAEKSAFYLLDKDSDEITADVYEQDMDEAEDVQKTTKMKLIGREKEVVASVAKTGLTVNIRNAYHDPKLGKEIDSKTGFIVRSVLSMAVRGFNDVSGVIEVINKKAGCFMKSDETLFEVFATYFSLVLEFSALNTECKKMEKLNILHLGILDRQSGPCKHDYNNLMNNINTKLPHTFTEFKWYISEDLIEQIPLLVFTMIKELSEPGELDFSNLAKFVLGMRKFQGKLPLHNFEKAFDFCHCMYNIIRRNHAMFTSIEIKALLVAGLGHCCCRKNTTNEFLIMTNNEMAQLYPQSPWQNYHYMITARLLEQFPIFADVKKADYILFLEEVQDCLINTDIKTQFFGKNIHLLAEIVKLNSFDNDDPLHHSLMKSLCACCCYLSGFCKPHTVVKKIAEHLYRELWMEGEEIKKINPGAILVDYFESKSQDAVAEQQILYIDHLVLRAGSLLMRIFPNTTDYFNGASGLRKSWSEIIDLRGRKIWKHEDSYLKKNP